MVYTVSLTSADKIETHSNREIPFKENIKVPKPLYFPLISPLQLSAVSKKYEISKVDPTIFKQKKYRAEVVRIVDGDTIDVRIPEIGENYHVRVRYIGIDTPEVKHPRKGVEPYGKEASLANKNLLQGQKVTLKLDVQRADKYGRLLAYVYVWKGPRRIFVNAWLVKKGYAQVSTFPPNVKYADKFLKLQRKARKQNRGLWGIEEQENKKKINSSSIKIHFRNNYRWGDLGVKAV